MFHTVLFKKKKKKTQAVFLCKEYIHCQVQSLMEAEKPCQFSESWVAEGKAGKGWPFLLAFHFTISPESV